MDCFDDNIAVELFEGSLSPELEREVEAHAARCSDCRQLLAELARSPSLAGVSPTIPAAGDAHIDLNQGDKVGRFSVLYRIGHGGMGVVFAAYDPKLDRKVALKLIRSTEDSSVTPEEAQARLLREAQAIAQQSHPNVISVYDVGTYKSEVYIAMELVEGQTLAQWLRQWKRPWRDVVNKFLEAGEALAAAHGSGLAHRDFKPDNVLVGHDERVRVMDFGLARSLFYDLPSGDELVNPAFRVSVNGVSELNRTLTRTGALLGTPRYMAPEQYLGGEADARSDQFSFCVALFEALYGIHPFSGNTAKKLAENPDTEPLGPPHNSVPRWLHRALLRGLEREPARRYPSMRALLPALRPPRVQRSRVWVAPVAVLGVALLAVGAYAWKIRLDRQHAWEEVQSARDEVEAATSLAESRADELKKIKSERDQLVAERDQLIDQLHESSDTTQRIHELEEAIVERDMAIAKLERRVRPDERVTTEPAVRGPGLSIGRVRRAVSPRIAEIKSCFAEWRQRQPRSDIAVLVRFEIGPDGAVGGVDMLGSPDKVLRVCVAGILAEVAFPASNGATEVEYQFDTTPTRFDYSSKISRRRAESAPIGESD